MNQLVSDDLLLVLIVAQRLLSAGRIQFKQTTLEIVPVPEDNPQVAEAEDTIEIQKIPKGTDKDKLQLFLENKKRSGGGDVVELILNETTGRAIVQFQDVAGESSTNVAFIIQNHCL